MSFNIAAVIPARYGSARFEGKPLVKIAGIPMIERVYRQVERAERFSRIMVATDDERIADLVRGFGGEVVITATEIASGTDRVWVVIKGTDIDGIVNIQGDEPLLDSDLIASVADQLSAGSRAMISAAYRSDSYQDYMSPHVVKVVLDSQGRALYFSRSPVPHTSKTDFSGFFHHIGIYGYHRHDLEAFVGWARSPLEKLENLEQLRFLEHGISIRIVTTNHPSMGVDVPEDVKKIEAILSGDNAEN